MAYEASHPGSKARPAGLEVIRIPPARQEEAVARLLGSTPGSGDGGVFLARARAEGLDLGLMWGTAERGSGGEVRQVCLVVPGAGRTAMFFISGGEPPAFGVQAAGPEVVTVQSADWAMADHGQEVAAERAMLLEAVVGDLQSGEVPRAARGLTLAQALVDPETGGPLVAAYQRAGFMRLAELGYLRREVPRRRAVWSGGPPGWPAGVQVVAVKDLPEAEVWSTAGPLAAALERSYIGTQDCPALCGMRSMEDVLESHRSVGRFDASMWWVIYAGDQPEGCMLLSPCDEQRTVELVYLGLGPDLRGKGLAKALLEMAMARLAGGPWRTLACAVDMTNTPALRLYQWAGFRSFTSRLAFVRALGR
ncbi:MAG: GNAT family N-acetyltransferase [Phycisphaerales bacterium]|jgi:ribosomal protein S18 acetylase RimI-like enzyme|nr:GNAT family N-acetyltransferase [Phycisphaerales bacterium]